MNTPYPATKLEKIRLTLMSEIKGHRKMLSAWEVDDPSHSKIIYQAQLGTYEHLLKLFFDDEVNK